MKKISIKEVFQTITILVDNAENTRWNRFYNYLMANSILILSWATIFTSQAKSKIQPDTSNLVMVLICILGAFSGVAWSVLGYRGSNFLWMYSGLGKSIESDQSLWPEELADYIPFTKMKELSNNLRFKKLNSYYILTFGPLLLSVFYIILFLVSINIL